MLKKEGQGAPWAARPGDYGIYIVPAPAPPRTYIRFRCLWTLAGQGRASARPGTPAQCRRHPPRRVPMLDVIYLVIGVVSFAATILYLPACDSL